MRHTLTPFVILTGASGVGKTSIAETIQNSHPEIAVYQGDRIGLPSEDVMASYGHTNEAGGPRQRGFALYWLGVIAGVLKTGKPVLLETQCRIAFLHESLSIHGIQNARIVLLECSDPARKTRLDHRGHPELANAQMSAWSRFLHREAEQFRHEILDTSALPLDVSTNHILSYFKE